MWIPPLHSLRRSVRPVAAPDCQSSPLLAPSHTSTSPVAGTDCPHTHTHRTGRYSGPPKPARPRSCPWRHSPPPARVSQATSPTCQLAQLDLHSRSQRSHARAHSLRVLLHGQTEPSDQGSGSSCWRSDLRTHTSGRPLRKKKVRNGV